MKPLILAGALLLLAFGGRTARTQQNSMPVTAETRNKAKLPAAGADTLIDSLPRGPGIVWLDKTTLLRFSLLPHAPGSLLSFHVVKWDTVGKKEIPAGNLPQWFAETNGDLYSIQVSPDGKYLLWTGEKVGPQRLPRPNIYYFAVITDVAGETKYECPIDDIGFIPKYPERWYGGSFADKLRWLPDSSHWIEFVSQNYRRNTPGALLVREITAAKVVKTLSIDPAAKNKAPGIPSLYGGKWITLRAGGGIRSSYDETQTSRLVLQNDKFSLLGSDVMYLAVDKAAYNFWALSRTVRGFSGCGIISRWTISKRFQRKIGHFQKFGLPTVTAKTSGAFFPLRPRRTQAASPLLKTRSGYRTGSESVFNMPERFTPCRTNRSKTV